MHDVYIVPCVSVRRVSYPVTFLYSNALCCVVNGITVLPDVDVHTLFDML